MKIKRKLTPATVLLIIFSTAGLQAAGQKTAEAGLPAAKRIVFLPFYFKGEGNAYDWVSQSVIEAINDEIGTIYRYSRVSDDEIEKARIRLNLTADELTRKKKAHALAEELNAAGILTGSYYLNQQTGQLNITGRILSVQQNSFISEESRSVTLDSQMFDEVSAMGVELGKSMKTLFVPSDIKASGMSAVYPGWGQQYKKYNQRAVWFRWGLGTSTVLTAGSLTTFYIFRNQYYTYTPDYTVSSEGDLVIKNPEASQAEMNRLRSRAETWQTISYILIGITAAGYLYNLFDAYILEQNPEEIYKPGYLKKNRVSFFLNSAPERQAYTVQHKYAMGAKYVIE